MSIVGTKEWEAACEAYIKSLEGKSAAELAHANCDHGNGYCAETVTNTFGG
jgi:hypothetical protein